MVELLHVLRTLALLIPILVIYTDWGPDHKCNHLSVRLGLVALFFEGGMDTMSVAPPHS